MSSRTSWRAISRRMAKGSLAQRGQALIEFSFIVVILLFLIVGVTDIATLLDVHESLVYAARQGARTGAVIGPVSGADCAIVGAIHSALINQPNLTLNTIYIYQATPGDGVLANGSRGSAVYEEYPGSVDCNSNGQIFNTQTGTTPQPPLVDGWPPTKADGSANRMDTPFTNDDSLGVELDYSYQFQFNILGTGNLTGFDYSVFQMNPAALPTPVPTQTTG